MARHRPPAEVAAAVLSATGGPHARLFLSPDASFEDVRAAYKRLLFLHPDKNPGCTACAEAFKVVASAFSELQLQHERRRSDAAQPGAAAAACAEQGHGRWGAFTARPMWAGHAAAPPHHDAGPPPAAGAAGAEGGPAKPAANRWGRPSAEFGKLLKANTVPQPARPAEQPQRAFGESQENNAPDKQAPSPEPAFPLGGVGQAVPPAAAAPAGVAPSAFYAARASSGGQPQPQQHGSLYSLFAGQPARQSGGFSSRQFGAAAPPGAATCCPSPSGKQEQHQHQGDLLSARSTGVAAGGGKWGSKSTLMELLRHPVPQTGAVPAGPCAASGVDAAAAPAQQSDAARGASKQQAKQRRVWVLESSSESENAAEPSESSGHVSSDAQSIDEASSSSSSDSGDDDVGNAEDARNPGSQAPPSDKANELQAVVQQHAAGALLFARGQGAAVIQAGRKRALQRHYSQGRGGGKKGSSGMQAKLQLVAVASGRKRMKQK